MAKPRKVRAKPDYERLVRECLAVVLSGEDAPNIYVKFRDNLVFPVDFPRGHAVERKEGYVIREIKARKLLDWLHKKGHVSASPRDLATAQLMLTQRFNKLFNMKEVEGEDE